MKTTPKMKSQVMPPKLRLKLANECKKLTDKAKLTPQSKKYQFHLLHSDQLDQKIFDKMMILFELLMKELYEKSSWGWDPVEKMAEWKDPKTRVILVTESASHNLPTLDVSYGKLPDDDQDLIGFMCFRFEIGSNKSQCALYVYELQIGPDHQRQGLGEELMRMARVLGTAFKMDKIMLTTFYSNQVALNFYKKLKFNTDESSPAKSECDYVILYSKLKI